MANAFTLRQIKLINQILNTRIHTNIIYYATHKEVKFTSDGAG